MINTHYQKQFKNRGEDYYRTDTDDKNSDYIKKTEGNNTGSSYTTHTRGWQLRIIWQTLRVNNTGLYNRHWTDRELTIQDYKTHQGNNYK